MPALLLYVVTNLVRLIREPGPGMLVNFIASVALFLLAGIVRLYATKLQDRIIRLEMRQRLAICLPDPLRGRIDELSPGQLIALRFASDAELPDLVRRVLDEHITKRDDIKQLIKSWTPDPLRV